MSAACRQAAAVGSLALLTLSLLAPLAAGLAPADGLRCCRGRCCCSGEQPSDTSCVRAACPCGRESHSLAPSIAESGEALLPTALSVGKPQAAAVTPVERSPAPLSGVPSVPDPPPWPVLSRPAF